VRGWARPDGKEHGHERAVGRNPRGKLGGSWMGCGGGGGGGVGNRRGGTVWWSERKRGEGGGVWGVAVRENRRARRRRRRGTVGVGAARETKGQGGVGRADAAEGRQPTEGTNPHRCSPGKERPRERGSLCVVGVGGWVQRGGGEGLIEVGCDRGHGAEKGKGTGKENQGEKENLGNDKRV